MSLKGLNIYLAMMITFLLNCCAFYSMSGSIPPHIKSISIPLIENETAEFGIAEEITDGIQKKFNDEGPYTYNKQESVSEYRFKVDVYFEWYDNRKEKTLFKGNFSGWGAYGLGGDISKDGIDNDGDGKIDSDDDNEFGEPREYASKVAIQKISEDIINDIMTTW